MNKYVVIRFDDIGCIRSRVVLTEEILNKWLEREQVEENSEIYQISKEFKLQDDELVEVK